MITYNNSSWSKVDTLNIQEFVDWFWRSSSFARPPNRSVDDGNFLLEIKMLPFVLNNSVTWIVLIVVVRSEPNHLDGLLRKIAELKTVV